MYMPMIPEAIEQAAPTRKATPVRIPRSSPKMLGIGDVLASTRAMTSADDHGADDGQEADRPVLAADEGDCALEDRAGDVLHRLGARVPGEDVAGQVQREQHRERCRRWG